MVRFAENDFNFWRTARKATSVRLGDLRIQRLLINLLLLNLPVKRSRALEPFCG
jgi:hypothetical protein